MSKKNSKRPETETEQIFKELTRQYSFKTRRQRLNSTAFYRTAESESSTSSLENSSDQKSLNTIEDANVENPTSSTLVRRTTLRDSYRTATGKLPVQRQSNVNNTSDTSTPSTPTSSAQSNPLQTDVKPTWQTKAKTKIKSMIKPTKKEKGHKRPTKKNEQPKSNESTISIDESRSSNGSSNGNSGPTNAKKSNGKQSTAEIEKSLLKKVCSLSISRHQSIHPTRISTAQPSSTITRSASKAKSNRIPPKRQISETLEAVAQNLSVGVEQAYGRLPSSSTYELPMDNKYDKDLLTPQSSDFSGAQSKTISPESLSSRGSIKKTNGEPDNGLPEDQAPTELVPPTPAGTVAGSRPTSAFFPETGSSQERTRRNTDRTEVLDGPDRSTEDTERDRAIQEIGGQLRDMFNDPQYNEELFSIQQNLAQLLTTEMANVQYENFVEVMQPFISRKNILGATQRHLDIEGIMISAQIASVLPDLTRKIFCWISDNLQISFSQLRQYSESKEDSDGDGSEV